MIVQRRLMRAVISVSASLFSSSYCEQPAVGVRFVGRRLFGDPTDGLEGVLLQSHQKRHQSGNCAAAAGRGFSREAAPRSREARRIGRFPHE